MSAACTTMSANNCGRYFNEYVGMSPKCVRLFSAHNTAGPYCDFHKFPCCTIAASDFCSYPEIAIDRICRRTLGCEPAPVKSTRRRQLPGWGKQVQAKSWRDRPRYG